MNANVMNATIMTASFSNREKIRRNPFAEPLGQPAPFAPLLGDIQDSVQDLQIVEHHVAAWCR